MTKPGELKRNEVTPPKWALRFLEWYCREDRLEQISGDLHEIYQREVTSGSSARAGIRYTWNVIRFFRLSNLKRADRYSPIHTTMLKHYFKLGFRNLVANRNYSLINVTGLALGLASVLLIALFVRHEYSFDRFHKKHRNIYRLVRINNSTESGGLAKIPGPVGPLVKQELSGVREMVRLMNTGSVLFDVNGKKNYEPRGFHADPSLFNVFSYTTLEGDPATMLSGPDAIVLTKSAARRHFGDKSALGESIVLNNDETVHVTGVVDDVPTNAHFAFDFLRPMEAERTGWRELWDRPQYYTYFEMDEETISIPVMEAAVMDLVTPHVPAERRNFSVKLQPLTSIHLHSNLLREMAPNGSMKSIYISISIAFIVLLVAVINYTTIFTARAAERLKEIGMRKVAGAKRGELIRQFLAEAFLLTALAAMVGTGITYLALPSFGSLMNTSLDFSPFADPMFLGAVVLGVLFVAIASGAYPAFYLSSVNAMTLQRGISVHRRSYTRHALVFLQLAVSAFLVAALSVVRQQTEFIRAKDLGFDRENIMAINIRSNDTKQKMDVVREKLLGISQVESVSFAATLLGGSDWGMPVKPEGIADADVPATRILVVDQMFLDTYHIGIAQGRNFSLDHPADEQTAVLINETAARAYGWANDAVGKKVDIPAMEKSAQVVGVVRDFHFRSLHEEIQPIVFFLGTPFYSSVSVRFSEMPSPETIKAISEFWQSIEPEYPMTWSFVDDTMQRLYVSEMTTQALVTWSGGLAIILACIGLFSLTAYESSLRSKEFGIRKVLGASTIQILGIQLKSYLVVSIVGAIVASGIAWWAMESWLSEFAYRVELMPWDFTTSIAITVGVALMTASFQSIRSAMVNPVKSIRTSA